MKNSILILMAAASLAAAACSGGSFKKGDGGLEYKFLKEGSADKAVDGDALAFHILVETDRDSVIGNSYEMELPQIQPLMADSLNPGSYKGDPNSILRMLGEGDSAVFRINLDTMAARTGQPKPEFADKYLQFTIKVEKHFKKGTTPDSLFYDEINKYYEASVEKLKNSEEAKLSSYIKKSKLEPKKTASDLQYVIEKEGTGNKAIVGDTVVINYTGSLAANGKIFDTSDSTLAKKNKIHNPMRPYEPIKVRIGKDPVIAGWTEGLQLLNKGSKAKLIIPSKLGYGPQGSMGAIPQFAPLVFDVEIVNIIAGPKEETPAPAPEVAPVH